MRRRTLLAMGGATALSGCMTRPPAPAGRAYRDPSAPFGATLRFDPARFAGLWHKQAGFGPEGGLPERFHYIEDGAGALLERRGPTAMAMAEPRRLLLSKPGRMTPMRKRTEEIWVLWVDEGFRTAVLALPSGRWAVILDRKPQGAADRLRAAREILEWSGFEMGALRAVG